MNKSFTHAADDTVDQCILHMRGCCGMFCQSSATAAMQLPAIWPLTQQLQLAASCSGGPVRNRRQRPESRHGLCTHLLVKRHGKLLMCDAGMRRAGIRLLRHDVQVDPLQDVLLRHTGTKPTACLSKDASGIRQASAPPPRASQPRRPHTRSTETVSRASLGFGSRPSPRSARSL